MSEATGASVRLLFTDSWWKVSRVFPALPEQVALARRFLRKMLDGCPVVDDAVLICSELVTNAVLHSDSAKPGGLFTVRAEVRDGDYVWLEVEDQGGRWVSHEPSETSGRGLGIVAGLADYWDVRGDDTARTVCARLDWPVPVCDTR
jgi:anti-sigma regulatory factor (Ser/Thr protein kinase)